MMLRLLSIGIVLLYAMTWKSLLSAKQNHLQPYALVHVEHANTIVLLVDKSECSVNIFRFNQQWKKEKSYFCTTGKFGGDKLIEGDQKTPTGVYWLTHAWTGKELVRYYGKEAEIYGVGAINLNYPNYLDTVFENKTGYGIWLHATNKDPIPLTKGCIAVTNADFYEIEQFVALQEQFVIKEGLSTRLSQKLQETPIIIEEQITYVSSQQVEQEKEEILSTLQAWEKAWEAEDVEQYMSFYAEEFRTPRFKNSRQWKTYKTIVNQTNQNREVQLTNVSIFRIKDTQSVFGQKNKYHVRFRQRYSSTNVSDFGVKDLYFIKKGEEYKIVGEDWQLAPDPIIIESSYTAVEPKLETTLN